MPLSYIRNGIECFFAKYQYTINKCIVNAFFFLAIIFILTYFYFIRCEHFCFSVRYYNVFFIVLD